MPLIWSGQIEVYSSPYRDQNNLKPVCCYRLNPPLGGPLLFL